jgi:anti-sigma regulatory factor (Ser/Thr protein kinase)
VATEITGSITVSPEIFSVLGAQLVSDPFTALSELVKNSYDADAELVEVRFVENEHRSIVVEDDGSGMTLDEIREGWLQIGTPLKRKASVSRMRKRVLVGSMGIGRLASFSVADEVNIQTGSGNTWYDYRLSFDEIVHSATLSAITVPIRKIKQVKERGTIITLTKVKWWPSEEQTDEIKHRLSVLSSPAGTKDFSISLQIQGQTTALEPETSLPAAPIVLDATIDGKGKIVSRLGANGELFEGVIPRTEKIAEQGKTISNTLRNVSLKVFWYSLGERPGQQYWKSSLQTQRALRNLSGVRVYRDGIRVLPYGETGDDWLDLQRRYVNAGPLSRNPRPQQVTGWVSISRLSNPELRDVANRQGLMNTPAFQELRKFCQDRMQEIAEFRRELEPPVPRKTEITPEDKPEIEKAVEVVRNAISGNPMLVERFSLVEKAIGSFFDQADVIALYRDRLTAGLLASLVMHDVGVPFRNISTLMIQASVENCNNERHRKVLPIIGALVPKVIEGYKLLGGGFSGSDYRIRKISVNEAVAANVAQMRAVSGSDRIQIKLEPDKESFSAYVRRTDLWAVITNFIANSIQASAYEHARGRDFPSEREIIIAFRRNGKDLELSCEDNGPGLPDKPEGWIWGAYNSTKSNGSGLGLYIISDVVSWYGGKKSAGPSSRFLSGARFDVTLPGVVRDD